MVQAVGPKRGYKVVIDRVDVRVRTAKPTQGRHIRQAIEPTHPLLRRVVGCDEETGKPFDGGMENTTTTRFSCEITDPQRAHQVFALVEAIADRFGFTEPPRLHTVEIALDVYLRGASIEQLAEIAADLAICSAAPADESWHCYRDKRGGGRKGFIEQLGGRRQVVRHLREGAQLANAWKRDDTRAREHCYVKTTDDGGRVVLPADQHRARFETRVLLDSGCFRTLDELKVVDLHRLALPRFKWRRRDEDARGDHLALLRAASVPLGQPGAHGRNKFRRGMPADTPLNKRADRLLRGLSDSWRRDSEPRAQGAARQKFLPDVASRSSTGAGTPGASTYISDRERRTSDVCTTPDTTQAIERCDEDEERCGAGGTDGSGAASVSATPRRGDAMVEPLQDQGVDRSLRTRSGDRTRS